jgi:TAT-translocated FGD2 family F420-dependent dehydrogenase
MMNLCGPAAGASTDRRDLLKWTAALSGALGVGAARAQTTPPAAPPVAPSPAAPSPGPAGVQAGGLRKGMFSFMLPHEQFPVPEIVQIGALASRAGFHVLSTSDHIQPWQANEGHAGSAWVSMGALGAQAPQSWMGTTVTCPTLRYNPAVVAEAFASLSLLYPGRIFLGVGSGEALNEEAATGIWPKWQERWDRLIEAITVIRALWAGQAVSHKGMYYTVNAKLYDKPAQPIPLLTAANGKKSMRLAGIHGDGLITDPTTWKQHKAEWESGARSAGKDPATMPVLVEQLVVVGDEAEAQKAVALWRFLPKAFKSFYNIPDPAEIQRQAEAKVSFDQVAKDWVISPDPAAHIGKMRELFDSGVTIVNVHTGQADQKRVIDFYGDRVLPAFRQPT